MENEKECDHGHIGQKYDERRGTGNGAFLCFECEKTVPELLAEATRRARAEAFREVDEEVEKEIGGCISGSDCQCPERERGMTMLELFLAGLLFGSMVASISLLITGHYIATICFQ